MDMYSDFPSEIIQKAIAKLVQISRKSDLEVTESDYDAVSKKLGLTKEEAKEIKVRYPKAVEIYLELRDSFNTAFPCESNKTKIIIENLAKVGPVYDWKIPREKILSIFNQYDLEEHEKKELFLCLSKTINLTQEIKEELFNLNKG